jgi:hypothetical protein
VSNAEALTALAARSAATAWQTFSLGLYWN